MFNLEPQTKPEISKCQICGRTLTGPESIRQGVGPVCGGTSSRKCQENNQMSLNFDRPELIICMDTGNGWTGFSDKGGTSCLRKRPLRFGTGHSFNLWSLEGKGNGTSLCRGNSRGNQGSSKAERD